MKGGSRGREWLLGIIGFPNSGKTSWLYSLLLGAKDDARARLGWQIGAVPPEFVALIDDPFYNHKAQATAAEKFKESRFCQMEKALIPGTRIVDPGSRRWIRIPEVGGETVRGSALGGINENGEIVGDARHALDAYEEFIDKSDMLLGFIGIDSRDGITGPLNMMKRIVSSHGGSGKNAHRKRPVTILLTKADLLRNDPARDNIEIPREMSAVAGMIESGRLESARPLLQRSGSDDLMARYSVSRILALPEVRSDFEAQERVAADFLRHDSPRAARKLIELKEMLGARVRCYLSCPFGDTFQDESGNFIKPSAEQIRPLMVFEPLEQLVDERWRSEFRTRWTRRTLVASVLLMLAWWMWPGHLSSIESAFDAAVVRKDKSGYDEARRLAMQMEGDYRARIERSWSEQKSVEQGYRWVDLRIQGANLDQSGVRELTEAEAAETEIMAIRHGVDPRTLVPGPTGELIALEDCTSPRDHDMIWSYLILSREDLPDRDLGMNLQDVVRLTDAASRWRADTVDRSDVADVRQRVEDIQAMLGGSGGSRVLDVETPRLLNRGLSRMHSETMAMGSMATIDSGLQAGRLQLVRNLDEKAFAEMKSGIDGDIASSIAAMGRPGFRKIADDRGQPHLQPSRVAMIEEKFDDWWSESRWAAVSDLPAMDTETLAGSGIPASIIKCRRIRDELTDYGLLTPSSPEEFQRYAADLDSIIDRQRVVSVLPERLEEPVDVDSIMRTVSQRAIDEMRLGFQPVITDLALRELGKAQKRLVGERLNMIYAGIIRSPGLGTSGLEWLKEIETVLDETFEARIAGGIDAALAAFQEVVLVRPLNEALVKSALLDLLEFAERSESDGEQVNQVILGAITGGRDYKDLFAIYTRAVPDDHEQLGGKIWDRVRDIDPDLHKNGGPEALARFLRAGDRWGKPVSGYATLVLEDAVRNAIGQSGESIEARADFIDEIAQAIKMSDVDVGSDLDFLGMLLAQEREDWISGLGDGSSLAEVVADSNAASIRMALVDRDSGRDAPFYPGLAELSEKLDEEMRLQDEWNLRPVLGGTGEPFWIAEREMVRPDLLSISEKDRDAWVALPFVREFLAMGDNPGLYRDDGMYAGPLGPGTPSLSFLGILKSEDAAALVDSMGLRLPTESEWRSAFDSVDSGSIGDLSFDVTTAEQLRRAGDVSSDGVVGLAYGVREWVIDLDEPVGNSSLSSTALNKNRKLWRDVGIRPALDFFGGCRP
ncbi:MAG: hypothetical protein CMJ34_01920 [Phycisphaerae bacterium]|nr:hypothetical protein [Phycisphaerae bacterium]